MRRAQGCEVRPVVTVSQGEGRARSEIRVIKDHYIVCGFGRVGEEIAKEFTKLGVEFVIVESSPEAIESAGKRGYLLLDGDAKSDEVLKEAGIGRALALLTAADSELDNAAVVLAARDVSPDIFIVSVAVNPAYEAGMLRAGADRVFSPDIAASRQLALSALRPILVGLADTSVVEQERGVLAEIGITVDGGLAGRTTL